MSLTVKNKIATFEEKNEQVRKSVIQPHRGRMMPEDVATTSDAKKSSTATSKASLSRKSRIQREVSNSPLPQQQREPSPTPETGSLRERRKARQQRQRERLGLASTSNGNSAPAPYSRTKPLPQAQKSTAAVDSTRSKRSSTRKPVHSSSASSSRSSKRQPRPERSRRAVDNAVSAESDEGDRALELSPSQRQRSARLAKAKESIRKSRSPRGKSSERQSERRQPQQQPEPVMMRESDTYFTNLLTPPIDHDATDDDDHTETSVRQIMQSDVEDHSSRQPKPLLARTSTSSFDTEGDSINNNQQPTNTAMSSFLLSRSHSSTAQTQGSSFPARTTEDDDGTYDYGNRDDDASSQISVTYEQRKEKERKDREEKERQQSANNAASPLINKDDLEFIQKNLDTPVAKTAAGVVAAATIGGIVLGPVGLLVGAAAVGLGVGIMQIPEESRQKAVQKAQESAMNASEKLTSTCSASCKDSGVTEHIPVDLAPCFTALDGNNSLTKDDDDAADANGQGDGTKAKGADKGPAAKKPQQSHGNDHTRTPLSPLHGGRSGKRGAAVLRHGRITPVDQIHSLQPEQQPRAWLDVMAHAETSRDEKNEALEEINILAKDKRHAHFFLEEGILDSIMLILNQYLETPRKPEDVQEHAHAKLTATCCVTLGKAHCAAVHTGGDLLLMSMYERGSVPEERQLAQMLYEVPHHVQIAKSADEDAFVLKTLTMPQAEELARSITAVAASNRL